MKENMSLSMAVRGAILGRTFAFRRYQWPDGQHVTIESYGRSFVPQMVFHRFVDSVITWPWSPTPDDVLSTDYEVVIVANTRTIKKED